MGFGASEFGSVAFGATTTAGGQTLSYSPTQVPRDGGTEFSVSGIPAGSYLVYFGPTGTTTDDPVYPGVPGGGEIVTVSSTSQILTLWLPPNPVGSSGLFFDPQGSGTLVATGNIIPVVPHPFRDKVLDLRALAPSGATARWATGYRSEQDVERPQL